MEGHGGHGRLEATSEEGWSLALNNIRSPSAIKVNLPCGWCTDPCSHLFFLAFFFFVFPTYSARTKSSPTKNFFSSTKIFLLFFFSFIPSSRKLYFRPFSNTLIH
ncbi:hypothetical protein F5X99DRAFT_391618 [Biscogniauxia marginata]|nr:hypothetical protein F5X99DRAFT_391618 [Biscogniauxia marginata]